MRAQVRFFHRNKTYGFATDNSGQDYFFNTGAFPQAEDRARLQVGSIVEGEVSQADRRGPSLVNAKLLVVDAGKEGGK